MRHFKDSQTLDLKRSRCPPVTTKWRHIATCHSPGFSDITPQDSFSQLASFSVQHECEMFSICYVTSEQTSNNKRHAALVACHKTSSQQPCLCTDPVRLAQDTAEIGWHLWIVDGCFPTGMRSNKGVTFNSYTGAILSDNSTGIGALRELGDTNLSYKTTTGR